MKKLLVAIFAILLFFGAQNVSGQLRILTVPQGGSSTSTITSGAVIYGNFTGAFLSVGPCSDNEILKYTSNVPLCGTDATGAGGGGADFGKTFELNAANSLSQISLSLPQPLDFL